MLSLPKLCYNMINSNQNLELFDEYIKKNNITKQKILTNLRDYPKRTFNNIKKSIPNIVNYIHSYYEQFYSSYEKFYVIGCPTSTDIDIVCIIDRQFLNNSVPLPLKNTELERLRIELNSIGYDTNRSIDINIICIEDKRCIGKSKGGDETINILLKTHTLHNQYYEFDIEIDFVEVSLIEKLKVITKFIFDYMEYAIIDYKNFRETKRRLYMEGIDSMMKYSYRLEELFKYRDEKNCLDFFKSLTMKIIQLILLKNSIYMYTKEELILISETYGFNKENIRYFLTRGNQGTFDMNTFRKLYQTFIQILNDYFASLDSKTIRIDNIINTTILSNTLFDEFLKSPNSYTDNFQIEYEKTFLENNVNDLFHINITPPEKINLPTHIINKHFIQIPQRSEEWIRLLNVYKCGNNGAEIKDTMEGTYNLLRGSITESILLDRFTPELLNLDGWEKINVGLLVENKNKNGCIGCAPDLILTKNNMIIPIEIKTLTDINHNSNYYKKLDLAKKQLQTIENILGSDIIYKKIIIMAYWKDRLYIECNIY